MLYVKFLVEDTIKYEDFLVLFAHMQKVREPNFKFDDEVDTSIDYANLTEEDFAYLLNPNRHIEKRFRTYIPEYVNELLHIYVGAKEETEDGLNSEVLSIFNYLESGFEVDFKESIKEVNHMKMITFTSGNYPFGGLERFLIVLKAFTLLPYECNDGFGIQEIEWISDFKYRYI
ncbi:hypothetical protein [Neptunitalea lumnitzerae]|uniref:Uncharacterized protein n=1 Tax=Neptunitalea lumnitzerae TaxID=2965509 RepID=A0ABQ5MIZ0_9FLAO|nr:hypothetical protein [Neptunitalea sp. Y10]GLB49380.1 hypothetical protein Y10_17480 [Neptunitalea sp. Y10]